MVVIPKFRLARFGLEDHGRDLGSPSCSGVRKASSRGRDLPSAISRLAFSAEAMPRPPGEKSLTVCLS